MAVFSEALPHILKAEGGPTVTGPEFDGYWTKYGITHVTLSEFRGTPCGEAEIRALTETEAGAVYKARYWDKCKLDQVTSTKKALCIMDQAVNRGTVTVIKQVQTICRTLGRYVTVDGVMGDSTIAAVNAIPEAIFCREFLQNCRHNYVNLTLNNSANLKFLKGWINRIDNVEDICWR